jgi:hypothetical protein
MHKKSDIIPAAQKIGPIPRSSKPKNGFSLAKLTLQAATFFNLSGLVEGI